MPRLTPAYRTRPRQARPFLEASARYVALLDADRRRRELVAVRMAVPRGRPTWIGLAIDYAITPALWALLVGMAASGQWWIIAAGAAHLVAVLALLRWDARAGAG